MTDEERAWLRSEFERCSPWIQAALDRDIGTHDLSDVWDYLADERAQLWPRPKSVVVTAVEYHPRKIVLRYWLCGGDELDDCLMSEAAIEAYGKKAGASCAVIGGRRAWVRALKDYREAGSYMVKDFVT